jgi:hypothetical protein
MSRTSAWDGHPSVRTPLNHRLHLPTRHFDTMVPAILGLVGAVIGALAAFGGQWFIDSRRRRDELVANEAIQQSDLLYSARIIRDDIVVAMDATYSAVSENRWWPEYFDLDPLATIDDWRLLAKNLDDGADMRRVFGSQRRFRQLRARRRSALQWPGSPDIPVSPTLTPEVELYCVAAHLDLEKARGVLSRLAKYVADPFNKPLEVPADLRKRAFEILNPDSPEAQGH